MAGRSIDMQARWNESYDVVIVGSGAGSVCAALAVKAAGGTALILEKTDRFGGSTALSGGVLWMPNNPVMKRAGVPDTLSAGRAYLDACAGREAPGSTRAKRDAFLSAGPRAVDFLESRGMKFIHSEGWSDYHESEYPGGVARGRSFEAALFDLRELGAWRERLRRHPVAPPVRVPDIAQINLNGRTWKSKWAFIRIAFLMLQQRLGRDLVRMGHALQGRLLQIAIRNDVDIRLQTPVRELITDAGAVTGVRIEHAGASRTIQAKRAVLIDAGGFAHNESMRRKFQRPGTSTQWTQSNPGDTGEIQEMAMQAGAAVNMMDEAWWLPSSRLPDGSLGSHNPTDLGKPHCLLVDSSGERYVDEATSYVAVGIAMYERDKTVPALPSWAILESRHRARYRWGTQAPGKPPQAWLDSGYMKRADTIEDLAHQCAMNPDVLKASIDRFNDFCRRGVDADFGRGNSAYHRYWGDPTVKPNPNLGEVSEAPFYAVQIYAGDVGTCGGLVTDEWARVLRADGAPIQGLYATGNSTASVVGRSYPGAGASIAASLVFGYIGAQHAMAADYGSSPAIEIRRKVSVSGTST
jgi:3-oxosteroid 1-dehydrogenase